MVSAHSGTLAAAETRQLGRGDLEAPGEQVEERRPRGGELIVDEEQARAMSVAESSDADVREVDGDLRWRHGLERRGDGAEGHLDEGWGVVRRDGVAERGLEGGGRFGSDPPRAVGIREFHEVRVVGASSR